MHLVFVPLFGVLTVIMPFNLKASSTQVLSLRGFGALILKLFHGFAPSFTVTKSSFSSLIVKRFA